MACFCIQLQSVRKQIKPVSGSVGMRKRQEEENTRYRTQSSLNGPNSSEDARKRLIANVMMKSPVRNPNQKPTAGLQKSPAVTRNAKKKWEMLDRKVCCFIVALFDTIMQGYDLMRFLLTPVY